MTEEITYVTIDGVGHRAYSAAELAGLAEIVSSMPMPAGDQPEQLILGSHTPDGDAQFGILLWSHGELAWRFVPGHLARPDGTEQPWPAQHPDDWPVGADSDQRWRA